MAKKEVDTYKNHTKKAVGIKSKKSAKVNIGLKAHTHTHKIIQAIAAYVLNLYLLF